MVASADTAADLVAELADQLYRVLERCQRLEKEIERALFNLPEARILKSLPGIGPRLGARILIEIGVIRQFGTSAQLAAYAGLGPTPHQSGTSLRGNRPPRFGSYRLKNAFCLARRRVDVLHAMLTTNSYYKAPTPMPELEAAA